MGIRTTILITTHCFTKVVVHGLLQAGDDANGVEALNQDDLLAAWEGSFTSDDPEAGGCVRLQLQ